MKEIAMKLTATAFLILTLSAYSLAMAQSDGVSNMDVKDMNVKNMPMEKMSSDSSAKTITHKATGTVKAVDAM